jgi:hypothetical protein
MKLIEPTMTNVAGVLLAIIPAIAAAALNILVFS